MNAPSNITREQVYLWLRDHPEFFGDHPDLLPSAINVSGRVLSLEAGKLDQLRRQNEQVREQLDAMVEKIRGNEEIYRTFHLVGMRVMDAANLTELILAVTGDLEEAFSIHRVAITLSDAEDGFGLGREKRPPLLEERLFFLERDTLRQVLGDPPAPIIRVGREGTNRQRFFGPHAESIRSEALIPLMDRSGGGARLVGSLNMGGSAPNRFLPHYSTDLIANLADVIALCMRKTISGR